MPVNSSPNPLKLNQQVTPPSSKGYSRVIRKKSAEELSDIISKFTSRKTEFKNTDWKNVYRKMEKIFDLADKIRLNTLESTGANKADQLEILCDFLSHELSAIASEIHYFKRNGSTLYNFLMDVIHVLLNIHTKKTPEIKGRYSFFDFQYRRQRSSTENEITLLKFERTKKIAAFNQHFSTEHAEYLEEIAKIDKTASDFADNFIAQNYAKL